MKNIFKNIKNYFKDNKTKSITILIILILTIVSSITLIAYSFYQNKSRRLIISGIASLDSADVSIKVYRENKNEMVLEQVLIHYHIMVQVVRHIIM